MRCRAAKRLALGAGLCVLVGLFSTGVAMSATHGRAAKATSTFGVNATGTVVFYQRAATDLAAAKLVPEFNKSHPHLHVVVTETCPNCDTSTLATAIRAGHPPDVVGLNDIDVPEFSSEGALMNLTKYINALPFKKYLSPGHLALGVYKGQEYGLPYLADLSVLWYNKKLFSQAGLNPNDPPKSFAQIVSDAQAINKLGNGINGFSFAGDCQGCLGFVMLPALFANKDQLITGPIGDQKIAIQNNSELKAELQMYQTLYQDHDTPASDLTDSGPTWGDDFEQGKIGILPGDYGFVAAIKKAGILNDVGIAPLPGDGGKYSTFDGGDDFVIPKGAKNPSGAWEFIQWMLQKSTQEQYPSLGETPVRTDVISTPGFTKNNPQDAVALNALKYGAAPVTLIYNAAFNVPNSPWYQMFTQAVYNNNLTSALATGQQGFQSVLASVHNK
jgi:multiple sugar transport system substrate-binding protein